jgi:hypothetical protein
MDKSQSNQAVGYGEIGVLFSDNIKTLRPDKHHVGAERENIFLNVYNNY